MTHRLTTSLSRQRNLKRYVQRNRIVENDGITVVPENNEAMTESYVMIDPAGRFFDNTQGSYRYSQPILKVGVEEALKQVSIDSERFHQRGGEYDWVNSLLLRDLMQRVNLLW